MSDERNAKKEIDQSLIFDLFAQILGVNKWVGILIFILCGILTIVTFFVIEKFVGIHFSAVLRELLVGIIGTIFTGIFFIIIFVLKKCTRLSGRQSASNDSKLGT